MIMNSKVFLLFFAIIVFGHTSIAQRADIDTSKILQLSGVVVSEHDLNPMPYITVYDRSIGRGVIADYYGYFSMVSFPGDTLYFSYYGYKTSSYVVPDTLKENRYSIIHMLSRIP